jgi:hypothetical protein
LRPGHSLPRGLAPLGRLAPFAALGLAGVAAGCVDPQGDYDAFVERTASQSVIDAGATDADTGQPCPQVLASQPSGTFFGACLTTASEGNAKDANYVVLNYAITADPGGTTGRLQVTQTFLVLNATNISQTVGPPNPYPSTPIDSNCTYVLDAGQLDIPAAANSFGVDLILSGTRYRGKILDADSSCSDLDATVTSPVTVDLTGGGNYCVFRRAPPDGAVTPFALSDFACPSAPATPSTNH